MSIEIFISQIIKNINDHFVILIYKIFNIMVKKCIKNNFGYTKFKIITKNELMHDQKIIKKNWK